MRNLYVIEKRDASGKLVFDGLQPEAVFGCGAYRGMDDNAMAQAIWRKVPGAVLDGRSIAAWPQLIDPQFHARVKYW